VRRLARIACGAVAGLALAPAWSGGGEYATLAPRIALATREAGMSRPGEAQGAMTVRDLLTLPQPAADETVAYGEAPAQFGELRLPKSGGPHPVAIVIHGGCWRARYGLDHVRALSAELTAAGIATWSLEYRRLGDPGGGWPGTFEDVAHGADQLRALATRFPLDLERVVAVGHSAGGHLALWLAARSRLPAAEPLRYGDPLALRGVVALAGIADLAAAAERQVCGSALTELVGAAPAEQAQRLALASPVALLPLGVAQHLLVGADDAIVPPDLVTAYAARAAASGDPVTAEVLEGAGHFELVNPASAAWPAVQRAVHLLLGPGAKR
jgi:acetyl esterase/lipase